MFLGLFPLFVALSSASLPPGHGKELGEHNDLGTPALEADWRGMTPLHFAERYVATRTPVILRGLAKTFPAFEKWTDEYILEHYGDLEVRLEAKTEKETYTPVGEVGRGRATFREFLSRYKTDNMYCVSEVPSPMFPELTLPGIMNCGGLGRSLAEVNLWMNSGGAKSIIHKDAHNQLNCLLAGSKEWIFINNTYNDAIYQAEEIDGDQGGYSLIDPVRVNYKTFPKFATVPWEYATVHAGDCLYLPPRYYHRVKSTDRNFAVSLLFGISSTFEMPASCGSSPADPVPLSSAPLQWAYPGHGLMSMGNSDPWMVKELFLEEFDLLGAKKGGKDEIEEGKDEVEKVIGAEGEGSGSVVTVDTADYISHILEELGEMPYARHSLRSMFLEDRILGEVAALTRAYLEELPDSFYYDVTAAFSFDPSNDPDAELYHIAKHQVMGALKKATYWGGIDKEQFLKTYTDQLSGSLRVGRQLWTALSSDGELVTWYDVTGKEGVFDVFEKEHDRGDGEMWERNEEVARRAAEELEESLKGQRNEL